MSAAAQERTQAWLRARSRDDLRAEARRHRSWVWSTAALENHVRGHRRDWVDAYGYPLPAERVRQLTDIVRNKPERVYVEVDAGGRATFHWVRGVEGRDARILVATRQGSVRTCFAFTSARRFGAWVQRHPGLVEVTNEVVEGRR